MSCMTENNRLTRRVNGGILRICQFGHDGQHCYRCADRGRCNAAIFERLAQFEDMEDQGRILIPPCNVGDTVYVINSLWVSEYTVTSVYWDGIFFQFKAENEAHAEDCRYFSFFDERVGKTVFLSREDAEKSIEGSRRL